MKTSTPLERIISTPHQITIVTPNPYTSAETKYFYCWMCDEELDTDLISEHFYKDDLQLCTDCGETYQQTLLNETFHLKIDQAIFLMQDFLFLKKLKQYKASDDNAYYFSAANDKNKTTLFKVNFRPNVDGLYDIYSKKNDNPQIAWSWYDTLDLAFCPNA